MHTFLTVLLIVAALVIIVAVMLTEPKTKGMGSLSGGDTDIFGMGSGKSGKEIMLNRVIVSAFAVFIICGILIQIVK